MKRGMRKRLMAAMMALLLVSGSALTVSAADIKPAVANGQSTITLHLYGSNQASENPGTGAEADKNTLPTGSEPIEGASFRYKQVGKVVQYNNGQEVGIRYEITDRQFAGMVGITNQNAEEVNGTSFIVPETLMQNLMSEKTASGAVNGFITNLKTLNDLDVTGQTSAEGTVTLNNMSGLYLFFSESMPSAVTSQVTPFLVAAPMPNTDGTGWNRDIHVYPKVANNPMALTKTASQGGAEDRHILAQSGKEITYTVTTTIPGGTSVGAMSNFETFVLTDHMNPGLISVTGEGSSSLIVTDKEGNNQNFTVRPENGQVKDIDVTPPTDQNDRTTTVTFTQAGLKKLNDLLVKGDAILTLKYKAVLGDGATLGRTGNMNTATVTYQRHGAQQKTIDATAVVYTYGVNLTKTLSDGEAVTDGMDIAFSLRKVSGNGEQATKTPLKFTKGASGAYWLSDGTSGEEAIVVPAGGKLQIYGLLPGTYELTETKSAAGYSKLDQPITIEIAAPQQSSLYGTKNATATADGLNMETDAQNAFRLTVVNTKQTTGFSLPKTGGAGTLAALAAGFGLVGFAVLLLLMNKRKNNGGN